MFLIRNDFEIDYFKIQFQTHQQITKLERERGGKNKIESCFVLKNHLMVKNN